MAAKEKRALHAKHHLNDENTPPLPAIPNSPQARNTGTVERKYRNERKKNTRKDVALESLKGKITSLSTEHKVAQDKIQHLQIRHEKLRNDIDLIVGPSATYKSATMDGKLFTRPEAIYTIQRIASDTMTYPHIRRLLASFLEGALETWIRFSREFTSGGKIDSATALYVGLPVCHYPTSTHGSCTRRMTQARTYLRP